VRNKVLSFALEIESVSPEAGEAPIGSRPIPEQVVQKVFNNNFYGSVGNVASGSQDFEQNARFHQAVQQASLNVDLVRLGQELSELRQSLVANATMPEHFDAISAIASAELEVAEGDEPKAMGYLSKAGTWVLDTATSIGTTIAAEALKKSIGLSG
jgi:hypothetical protein